VRLASIRILVTALAASLIWGCSAPTVPASPGIATAAVTPAGPIPSGVTSGSIPVPTGGPPPSAAAGADPCRLVTQAEVQQAAALRFAVGHRDGSDCDFVGDHNQGNDMTIVVSTDNENNIGGARLGFADGHTVTGLGNDAWWSPSITELWVDLGNGGTLQVQIIPIGSPVDQDYFPIAQALAKIALSRL
jgi:hypothetical protein